MAGIVKLYDPWALAQTIDAIGILPRECIVPVSLILPVVEVLAAAGLIFDVRGSLSVVTGLILLFIGILAYAIWLELDIDCGCYGPGDPEIEAFVNLRRSLYRDLGMLAGAGYLYIWRVRRGIESVAV